MALSANKSKAVRRLHADGMTAPEIARRLNVALADVEQALAPAARSVAAAPREAGLDWLAYVLLVFAFVPPLVFKRKIMEFSLQPKMALIQCGAALLVALWLGRGVAARRLAVWLPPPALPLGCFLLWCAISLAWCPYVYDGVFSLSQWVACYVVYLVYAQALGTRALVQRLLAAIFWSAVTVALIGWAQHLLGLNWIPQPAAPASTMANKNFASQYMVLTLPLGAALFLQAQAVRAQWRYALGTSAIATYVVYTGTRAAWLAVAVQLLLLAALLVADRFAPQRLRWGWTRQKLLALATAALVVLVCMNLTRTGFHWVFEKEFQRVLKDVGPYLGWTPAPPTAPALPTATTGTLTPATVPPPLALPAGPAPTTVGETSLTGRIAIVKNSWVMVREHFLFGVGMGGHNVEYPRYARRAVYDKWYTESLQLESAHNDYIQTWAEQGTVGMLLLLWVVAVLLWRVGRRLWQAEQECRWPALALFLGLAGIAVEAFFDFPFQRPIPPFTVALYLAVLGALWRQQEEVTPRPVPLPVAKASLAVAVVAVPVLLHLHYRLLVAEWYHNRVTVAEGMGLWSEVIASGREGMRLNPWHVKVISTLARGYVESGQVATGVALMEKALRWSPNDINRIANYGAALVRMGRTADAKAAFERALALTPDYARALSGLGTVHLDAGEYELALGRFQQAAIYEPANPQYHFNVGVALLKLKRNHEALAAFRAAVERKPDWALAQKNVGVLLLNDDPVQAILHLRRAVELDPRIEGHEQIRQMCEQAGRPLPPLR